MASERREDEEAAAERTSQNRDIGPRVHQTVAGHQLLVVKKLRQDAELERAEEGGLRPHAEEQKDEPPEVHRLEGRGRETHENNLHKLYYADEEGLFIFVGDLPRKR